MEDILKNKNKPKKKRNPAELVCLHLQSLVQIDQQGSDPCVILLDLLLVALIPLGTALTMASIHIALTLNSGHSNWSQYEQADLSTVYSLSGRV